MVALPPRGTHDEASGGPTRCHRDFPRERWQVPAPRVRPHCGFGAPALGRRTAARTSTGTVPTSARENGRAPQEGEGLNES